MVDLTYLTEQLSAKATLPDPEERRRVRESAGVSAATIARTMEKTRQCVSAWERGDRQPRGQDLLDYLRVLELLRGATP